MSIPFLSPEDDVLDTHVDDLDSFELFDEQNMLEDRMSDDDAKTEVFDSSDRSSCFEPDTTTSPPIKTKTSRSISRHTTCSKRNLPSAGSIFFCHIQLILGYQTCVYTKTVSAKDSWL